MADEKKNAPDTVTVNLRNPTTARRVIYDGITVETMQGGKQKMITIDPGVTKENVTLHKSIVAELRERNKLKRDSDLLVLPMTAPTDEKEKTAA